MPFGPGRHLLWNCDASRLWSPLPASQFSLHRLLRAGRWGRGLGCQVYQRAGFRNRLPRPSGNRSHYTLRSARPCRDFLPVRSGREPVATFAASTRQNQRHQRPACAHLAEKKSLTSRTGHSSGSWLPLKTGVPIFTAPDRSMYREVGEVDRWSIPQKSITMHCALSSHAQQLRNALLHPHSCSTTVAPNTCAEMSYTRISRVTCVWHDLCTLQLSSR